MKRRIVFVDQTLISGGAERVLCTIMRMLDPKVFEIHLVLVSYLSSFEYLIPDNVKVHILGIKNSRNALPAFIKKINKIKPDKVFSTSNRTTILVILARFFSINYKIIARYPSMPSLEIKEGLSGWRLWLMKKFYKKVDLIVAQTIEMAAELHEYYQIKTDQIITITNPIDTNNIDDCIKEVENPFKGNNINVVASGRISYEKGFDILIKSFELIIKKNSNFHLHIIGRDEHNNQEKLQQMAIDLKISNHVHFYGFQKNPYMFYKFCDLFVLSSRREGLPNVVLECQYLNKPIVATKCIPVIERLIQHGENGYLVNVEDHIQLAKKILKFKDLVIKSKNNKVKKECFIDLFK